MNRRTFLKSAGWALGTQVPLAAASRIEPTFTVGGARRDITPEPGISLSGTISRGGKARGVHDPLHARATVIECGGERVALVVVDACYLGEAVFSLAAREVQSRTGIPLSHLLISTTHSHAAPRALQIGRLSELDDAWHFALPTKIAEAVAEADAQREPARLFAGVMKLPELVQCRRSYAELATVPPNPFGERGEKVVSVQSGAAKRTGPAGAVDPDFGLLYATRVDGSPLLVFGNFSVHYAGGYANAQISADYFGAFCRHVEKRLGPAARGRPFTALHSNGTSGDTGLIGTPSELRQRQFAPFERGEIVGEWLAARVEGQLPTLRPVSAARVRADRRLLSFGIRRPGAERLAWARDVLAGKIKGTHHQAKTYADEAQRLAAFPEGVQLPLQVIRIGDVALAASPCEMFAETGLAIKAASPAAQTFVLGLANGYGGYLPPAAQHALGGYEAWPARSSFLAEPAEGLLRRTLGEMVRA